MLKVLSDRVCWTPGVEALIVDKRCTVDHLSRCIALHLGGEWGSVDEHDKAANDRALQEGGRLLSAYPIDATLPCRGWGDNTIWIITEADRSVTTILLPQEY